MEGEYEKKRQALIEYYESVRHAQAVTVDEIPLPNLDMPPMPEDALSDMAPPPEVVPLPVPNVHMVPTHSILKKMSSYITPPSEPKKPPGCPPTLPPELSDDDDDDDDEPMDTEPVVPGMEKEDATADKEDDDEDEKEDSEDEKEKPKSRTIRFVDSDDSDEEKDTRVTISKSKGLTSLQTKLLQMSGQDIDDFMRETEVLFKEKEAERKADLRARLDKLPSFDEEAASATIQQPMLTVPPPQTRPAGAPPPVGVPPVNVAAPQTNPNNPSVAQTGFPPPTAAPAGVLPGVPGVALPVAPPGTAIPNAQTQVVQPGGAPVPVQPVSQPMGPPVVPPGVPPVAPPGAPPTGPPGAPPLMFRPPPMRTPGIPHPPGVRLPPGPPPQGMPPRLPNMRMPPPMPPRLPMRPPGVPPGMPPPGLPPRGLPPVHNPNVLSAGPQLIARPRDDDKKHSATIEAKPQIRYVG